MRTRVIQPALAVLTLREHDETIGAFGHVRREVWEEEYACLRLREEN